jgi:outer membrane beta-barrel protein
MRTKATLVGLVALGTLATGVAPATAQVKANTSEIHLYAGELFGDNLTDKDVSGRRPELHDDVTFGVRYGYNFTDAWGLEVSAGRSPNQATRTPGGDINLDLTTLDVDAVWHFTPKAHIVGYLVGGAGYALSSLDHPIRGTVQGVAVSIGDDNGFTLNGGVGAEFFTTSSFMIRVEARYRYVDRLVDRFDTSLSTVETTAGVGWAF